MRDQIIKASDLEREIREYEPNKRVKSANTSPLGPDDDERTVIIEYPRALSAEP